MTIPNWILVVPRVFLGLIFGVAVMAKLTSPAPFSTVLVGFLTHMLPNALPLYADFAQSVVIPHAGVFAFMVIAGELYVALAMLTGTTTRLAAVVAVLLLSNYMLTKGTNMWTPSSNDAADIVLAVVVGVCAAGRVFGVDRWLNGRWPNVALW